MHDTDQPHASCSSMCVSNGPKHQAGAEHALEIIRIQVMCRPRCRCHRVTHQSRGPVKCRHSGLGAQTSQDRRCRLEMPWSTCLSGVSCRAAALCHCSAMSSDVRLRGACHSIDAHRFCHVSVHSSQQWTLRISSHQRQLSSSPQLQQPATCQHSCAAGQTCHATTLLHLCKV
jgi:hypothetical protein